MNDYIIRATAANDQIRAFAAVTTEMVETAREHHNTSPVATAALGRLLTAGAMMGSMMKGEKDVLTLQIKRTVPFKKDEEVHYQRAYPLEKIKELIGKAGMELLAVYDAYTLEPPKEDSGRLTFVVREHGK